MVLRVVLLLVVVLLLLELPAVDLVCSMAPYVSCRPRQTPRQNYSHRYPFRHPILHPDCRLPSNARSLDHCSPFSPPQIPSTHLHPKKEDVYKKIYL